MRIWFFTPYSLNKDIGKEYNKYCSIVPEDDWICLMDADTMFLTSNFGHKIKQYIEKYPECQFFIPTVSRVKNKNLCYQKTLSDDPNLLNHKKIADSISDSLEIEDITEAGSLTMPCFIFSKKLWKKIKGFKQRKTILGVDWRFGKKAKRKSPCYKMLGLYLVHFYRLDTDIKDVSHLQ